ncbi:MAG: hypothetical protein IMZ44_25400 [Planctomycetes bacterium]|nr:hypothetical protein [Planctomycetota bacterium]
MRQWTAASVLLAGIASASLLAQAPARHDEKMKPAAATSPAFEQIKALAGEWEGKVQGSPAQTSFRVVSAGSAVMNLLKPENEPEMVTMFHLDGSALMVTHYCSAGNQPRMVAASASNPKVITFTFKDVTNLASPTAGHMRGLVLTMVDADHHTQQWTFRQDGKDQAEVFEFTRKK